MTNPLEQYEITFVGLDGLHHSWPLPEHKGAVVHPQLGVNRLAEPAALAARPQEPQQAACTCTFASAGSYPRMHFDTCPLAARPQEPTASQPQGEIHYVGSPANVRATFLRLADDVRDEDGKVDKGALDKLVAFAYRQQASQPPEAQDYWTWQPDGENHLESLANDCRVLIRAADLRAEIQRGQQAMAEKAAATICCFCAEGIPLAKEKQHEGGRHCYAHAIRSLTAAVEPPQEPKQ